MKNGFTLVAIALAATLAAAAAPGDVQQEKMAALSMMVGEWEGEGWITMGPAVRSTFRSREIVESRLDGRLLIVEGIHEGLDGARAGEIVHHAIGVLSWDTQENGYRFRTYLANRPGGTFEASVDGRRLVWGMEHPGAGSIRYTIEFTEDGRWVEVGERSTDGGQNWQHFFSMSLERVRLSGPAASTSRPEDPSGR